MKSKIGLPAELTHKFDIFDWRNGMAILRSVHEEELVEVVDVLSRFELPWSQLAEKGKNKTESAKVLDPSLYKLGWVEKSFETKIVSAVGDA